jgi:hypothetical protein
LEAKNKDPILLASKTQIGVFLAFAKAKKAKKKKSHNKRVLIVLHDRLGIELEFAQELEKMPVTQLSMLELHIEATNHDPGALVLCLFGMHHIRTNTRRPRVILEYHHFNVIMSSRSRSLYILLLHAWYLCMLKKITYENVKIILVTNTWTGEAKVIPCFVSNKSKLKVSMELWRTSTT